MITTLVIGDECFSPTGAGVVGGVVFKVADAEDIVGVTEAAAESAAGVRVTGFALGLGGVVSVADVGVVDTVLSAIHIQYCKGF